MNNYINGDSMNFNDAYARTYPDYYLKPVIPFGWQVVKHTFVDIQRLKEQQVKEQQDIDLLTAVYDRLEDDDFSYSANRQMDHNYSFNMYLHCRVSKLDKVSASFDYSHDIYCVFATKKRKYPIIFDIQSHRFNDIKMLETLVSLIMDCVNDYGNSFISNNSIPSFRRRIEQIILDKGIEIEIEDD